MNTKPNKKMISIRLSEEHLEYITQKADQEGIPKVRVIEEALTQYAQKHQRSDISKYKGIAKGMYGSTTEEVDRYIKELRSEWD